MILVYHLTKAEVLLLWILLKRLDLLDDKKTYEQISQKTILKNVNDFDKSYKKILSKENKSRSSLINYPLIIPKVYDLYKTHTPEIP